MLPLPHPHPLLCFFISSFAGPSPSHPWPKPVLFFFFGACPGGRQFVDRATGGGGVRLDRSRPASPSTGRWRPAGAVPNLPAYHHQRPAPTWTGAWSSRSSEPPTSSAGQTDRVKSAVVVPFPLSPPAPPLSIPPPPAGPERTRFRIPWVCRSPPSSTKVRAARVGGWRSSAPDDEFRPLELNGPGNPHGPHRVDSRRRGRQPARAPNEAWRLQPFWTALTPTRGCAPARRRVPHCPQGMPDLERAGPGLAAPRCSGRHPHLRLRRGSSGRRHQRPPSHRPPTSGGFARPPRRPPPAPPAAFGQQTIPIHLVCGPSVVASGFPSGPSSVAARGGCRPPFRACHQPSAQVVWAKDRPPGIVLGPTILGRIAHRPPSTPPVRPKPCPP